MSKSNIKALIELHFLDHEASQIIKSESSTPTLYHLQLG